MRRPTSRAVSHERMMLEREAFPLRSMAIRGASGTGSRANDARLPPLAHRRVPEARLIRASGGGKARAPRTRFARTFHHRRSPKGLDATPADRVRRAHRVRVGD